MPDVNNPLIASRTIDQASAACRRPGAAKQVAAAKAMQDEKNQLLFRRSQMRSLPVDPFL
ncbi:hypothetical protein [Novosphingobium sp. RL4]|uniref:hypothetical protein n=1 Tax=Novosphingobium sp. RL4 TaxID=3109595 RepID=UPI002D78413F|nr:hypothetical protein [Novosphingobium sp. RL4]WRT93972.1 hypothetical protein U9J33_05535 [Novosphingobium sp. RL4]